MTHGFVYTFPSIHSYILWYTKMQVLITKNYALRRNKLVLPSFSVPLTKSLSPFYGFYHVQLFLMTVAMNVKNKIIIKNSSF